MPYLYRADELFEPDIKNNPFYDLPAGWYVISGDVTVTSRIRLNGDVKFILTDGAQLDAKWGIDLGAGRHLYHLCSD